MTEDEAPWGVLLLTGVMAAGKSTVAQLLAERLERSVHVRGDVFRRFLVSGRAEPTPEMTDEAWAQLMLRYRLAAATADTYAAAGFAVVAQDVIIGPVLPEVVAMVQARPRYLVVLDPDPAAVLRREASRAKSGYVGGWETADMVREFRRVTPRLGLWLNTSDQEPRETAQDILDRLPEAQVDEVAQNTPGR